MASPMWPAMGSGSCRSYRAPPPAVPVHAGAGAGPPLLENPPTSGLASDSRRDSLTLGLDLTSLPTDLPPLRDGASEAEVEAWVERFIDASAQPTEVSHAR